MIFALKLEPMKSSQYNFNTHFRDADDRNKGSKGSAAEPSKTCSLANKSNSRHHFILSGRQRE
jgi:hypothetical protein